MTPEQVVVSILRSAFDIEDYGNVDDIAKTIVKRIRQTDRERTDAEHARYMVLVDKLWHNLPEDWSSDFPTATHLRKWALCRTGWCYTQTWPCDSVDEAVRIGRRLRMFDPYMVIVRKKDVLYVMQARSQAYKANNPNGMNKTEFRESSEAVLNYICATIGVDLDDLEKAA